MADAREYAVMRFPGGAAFVGRNATLFKTPIPDEAIEHVTAEWSVEIRTFDDLASAMRWSKENATEVFPVDGPGRRPPVRKTNRPLPQRTKRSSR
jgi:hypothetical protein